MHLSFKKCIHFGTKLILLVPQAQAWLCFSRDCLPDTPLCSLDGSWLLSNWKRLRHQHLSFLVSNRSSHRLVWIYFFGIIFLEETKKWKQFPFPIQEVLSRLISRNSVTASVVPSLVFLTFLLLFLSQLLKKNPVLKFCLFSCLPLSLLEPPPISHITVGYRTVELHAP